MLNYMAHNEGRRTEFCLTLPALINTAFSTMMNSLVGHVRAAEKQKNRTREMRPQTQCL
jgi:hypothetical protein